MSEEITQPEEVAVEQQTEQVQVEETPEIELASDKQEAEESKLSYEELEARYKELEEKNKNAEDVAKRLKDEKSQQNRELSEQEKIAEAETAKQNFIQENINQFIEQGMVATPEQLELAAEHGITPEQIELAAYKARENADRVYGIVGGKEEYNNMIETMREHLTPEQQKEYSEAVMNPNTSSFAVKGLYADYLQMTGKAPQPNKITPSATTQSTNSGAYKTMQDYYTDMRTMRSLPQQQQKAYYNKIQEKLNRSNLV